MNEHGSARTETGFSRFTVPAMLASTLGAATVLLVGGKFGLGASNDSVLYLSAADHLLEGKGLTDFRGDPLVIFPPLFSTLVAIIGWIVGSVDSAARILQTLLYAGNFVLGTTLLVRLVRSFAWIVVGTALLLVSRTFLLYHYYVLSEPLFVLLTLATILLLCKWTDSFKPSILIWAALFAALSCLTRYPGIANVVLGLLVVLASRMPLRRRVAQTLAFGLVSLAPPAIWLIRNVLLTRTLTGTRLPSPYPIILNLQQVADSLALWFVPDELPQTVRLGLIAMAVVGLVTFFWWSRNREKGGWMLEDHTIVGTAVATHLLVLVAAVSILASDYITTRFVMPVYVPLLVLIISSSSWIFDRFRPVRPLLFMALAAWFGIQLLTTTRLVTDRYANGVGGFATSAWEDSEVMQFLRDHPGELGTDAFSNATLGVYFHTGLVLEFFPDFLNPRWVDDYPPESLRDRPAIDDVRALVEAPDRKVTIVWFETQTRDPRFEATYLFNQYDLAQIRDLFTLDPVFEAEDGGVYRVTNVQARTTD